MALSDFLGDCAVALTAGATSEIAALGASRFTAALPATSAFDGPPSWLPVLDTLPALPENELSRQLIDLAPDLPWTPTHRRDERGDLDGGTDIALCLLDQVLTDPDVTAGLSYMGPHRRYPLHHHAPQEIYLAIAGTAEWRYGGADEFVSVAPGQVIYNHPNDIHSMVTAAESLLALWVLF